MLKLVLDLHKSHSNFKIKLNHLNLHMNLNSSVVHNNIKSTMVTRQGTYWHKANAVQEIAMDAFLKVWRQKLSLLAFKYFDCGYIVIQTPVLGNFSSYLLWTIYQYETFFRPFLDLGLCFTGSLCNEYSTTTKIVAYHEISSNFEHLEQLN